MSLPFFDISKHCIIDINPVYSSLFNINFSFKTYDKLYEDMILNCFAYDLAYDTISLHFHYNENTNITEYIKSFYNLDNIIIEQNDKSGHIFKTLKFVLLKFKNFKLSQDHNKHNSLSTIVFELSYGDFNEQ